MIRWLGAGESGAVKRSPGRIIENLPQPRTSGPWILNSSWGARTCRSRLQTTAAESEAGFPRPRRRELVIQSIANLPHLGTVIDHRPYVEFRLDPRLEGLPLHDGVGPPVSDGDGRADRDRRRTSPAMTTSAVATIHAARTHDEDQISVLAPHSEHNGRSRHYRCASLMPSESGSSAIDSPRNIGERRTRCSIVWADIA